MKKMRQIVTYGNKIYQYDIKSRKRFLDINPLGINIFGNAITVYKSDTISLKTVKNTVEKMSWWIAEKMKIICMDRFPDNISCPEFTLKFFRAQGLWSPHEMSYSGLNDKMVNYSVNFESQNLLEEHFVKMTACSDGYYVAIKCRGGVADSDIKQSIRWAKEMVSDRIAYSKMQAQVREMGYFGMVDEELQMYLYPEGVKQGRTTI